MKERAKELKAEARRDKEKADEESEVLAKIAEMPGRIASWPSGSTRSSRPAPRPRAEDLVRDAAYARDGKIVCFFPAADKFKARYATFGFNEDAASTTARCGRHPGRSPS